MRVAREAVLSPAFRIGSKAPSCRPVARQRRAESDRKGTRSQRDDAWDWPKSIQRIDDLRRVTFPWPQGRPPGCFGFRARRRPCDWAGRRFNRSARLCSLDTLRPAPLPGDSPVHGKGSEDGHLAMVLANVAEASLAHQRGQRALHAVRGRLETIEHLHREKRDPHGQVLWRTPIRDVNLTGWTKKRSSPFERAKFVGRREVVEEKRRGDAIEGALVEWGLVGESLAKLDLDTLLVRFPARDRQDLGIAVEPDDLCRWNRSLQHQRERAGAAPDVENTMAGLHVRLRQQQAPKPVLLHRRVDEPIVEACQRRKPQRRHVVAFRRFGNRGHVRTDATDSGTEAPALAPHISVAIETNRDAGVAGQVWRHEFRIRSARLTAREGDS